MSEEAETRTVARGRAQVAAERTLGSLLTAVALGWALDVPQRLEIALFTEQFLAAILALTLPLAFLVTSRGRALRGTASGLDIACAAIGFLAAGYVAWRYPELQNRLVYRPTDGVVIGAILLVLVIEGVRRTCGLALVLVILFFIAYALLGHFVPGTLGARPVQWDRLIVYLAMDTNAMIGGPLLIASEVVIAFIFMGQIISRGGGGQFFADLALAVAGKARGGAGKIAVVGSMLFGMISGSAVANVASVGVITIPLMKRSGFQGHVAAATEALASTGGQLMPPVMGAAAFLMAEFLGVPYRTVALAAIGPSLIYYFSLFVFIDFYAARHRIRFAVVEQPVPMRRIFATGWHFPIPFFGLFAALFWLNWTAQLSGLFASALLVVFCMIVGYRGKRMSLRDLGAAIVGTGTSVLEVVLICAGAGLIIGVLNLTGVAFGLTLFLGDLAASNIFVLLLMTAVIATILGMGMPTVAVYVLLATLIAPAMIKAQLDPVAVHLFLMYFGMLSMVTPPVALAAFTAAGIAKADLWQTGWQSVKMGWIAYLAPFVFVFQPSLLFRGSPVLGVIDLVTLAAGVAFGTAALLGQFNRPIGAAARMLLLLAALAVIMPVEGLGAGWSSTLELWQGTKIAITGSDLGWVINIVGLLLGGAMLALHGRATPAALGTPGLQQAK